MKTITIWQPWASLIATGAKRIETRLWTTRYRGPLAIHAAKAMPKIGESQRFYEPFFSVLDKAGYRFTFQFPLGSIVATCNMVDCVLITPEFVATLSEQERAFGDYTPGRYAWILEDVKALPEPIPAKGKQGLWNWDGDLSV